MRVVNRRRSVSAFGMLFVLVIFACKRPEASDSSTSSPTGTGGATSRAAMKATPLVGGSIVQVDFEGLVSHVIPMNAAVTTDRAVVMKDDPKHLHSFVLIIPPVNQSEADLEFIGTDVDCTSDPNAGCLITGIKPVTLTVPDMKAALETALSFATFVPSLDDANGSPIDPGDLHADLALAVPKSASPFLAYFNFTGGTLSAVPYCGRGAFDRGINLVQRRFGRVVTLFGTTTADAQLVVDDGTTTKTFTFQHPDHVFIKLRNMPTNPGVKADHFPIYNNVFKAGKANLPEVNDDEACNPKGTVVGCSNSQWP